ncbi:hypothetical protein PR048_033100 [Dryococelus australis]|uniref:Gag-like protein n=1 Tax=Dryococelus australis TaxID=614101 RepID=A0ABQ9FZB2_9NEOP|nr:hypothetical protein PR048_033100 [Dryococelus australis]
MVVRRTKKVQKSASRRAALSLTGADKSAKKVTGGNSGQGGDRAEIPTKSKLSKRVSPQKGSSGPPVDVDKERPAEGSQVAKTSADVNAAQAATGWPPQTKESGQEGGDGPAATVPLAMPVVEPRKPHDEAGAIITAISSLLGNIPAVEGEAAVPAIRHCLEKLRALVGEQYQTSVRLQGRLEAVAAVHRQQANLQEAPLRRPTFSTVLAGGSTGAGAPLPPQVVGSHCAQKGSSGTARGDWKISHPDQGEDNEGACSHKSSLKVRAMRRIAGGDIAVEVADDATMDSVRRLVAARPEELKIRELQKLNPSVVVYDVPRTVASPEGLVDAIFGKNLSTEAEARGELLRGFKVRRKFGNRQAPEVNVVVQCSPALRNLLIKDCMLDSAAAESITTWHQCGATNARGSATIRCAVRQRSQPVASAGRKGMTSVIALKRVWKA